MAIAAFSANPTLIARGAKLVSWAAMANADFGTPYELNEHVYGITMQIAGTLGVGDFHGDRESTPLNSPHPIIPYSRFFFEKKKKENENTTTSSIILFASQ